MYRRSVESSNSCMVEGDPGWEKHSGRGISSAAGEGRLLLQVCLNAWTDIV